MRGPQGMHPTPRAEELSQPLRAALADISAALSPVQFDPATADMSFVVATSDFISALSSRLSWRGEREAPGVRLWLRLFNDLNLVEELDRGTLHLVVGAFGRVPSRFRREPLVSVDSVWIMREGHPASSAALTIETLGHYPHIDVLLSGRAAMEAAGMQEQEGLERAFVTSNPPFLEGLLRDAGLSRRIGATVSLILAVPPLVASTDMIALVPRSVAETYKDTYGLVLHEAPYPLPATQINMLSHNTFGAHPAVAWLRSILREAIKPHNPGQQARLADRDYCGRRIICRSSSCCSW